MKHILIYSLLFATVLIYACQQTPSTPPEKADPKDSILISSIYQNNLFIIEAATEALTRSTFTDTKKLASDVIGQSKWFKNELDELAGRKGIMLPLDVSDSQKSNWQHLVKQKGYDFDKEFVELFLRSHNFQKSVLNTVATNSLDLQIREKAKELLDAWNQSQELALEVKKLINMRTHKDSINTSVVVH